METLERLWTKATEGSEFTPKFCINAMAGLWAATKHHSYLLKVTNEPTDVRFDGPVSVRDTPEGEEGERDYIMQIEQIKLSSLRPIHQLCLEAECSEGALHHPQALRAHEPNPFDSSGRHLLPTCQEDRS